jgi:hypothetical protein
MAQIHRIAYAVTDAGSKPDEAQTKARWTRVGVTFLNRDESETVVLDAIPVNGRLVLQKPKNDQPTES